MEYITLKEAINMTVYSLDWLYKRTHDKDFPKTKKLLMGGNYSSKKMIG